MSGMSVPLCAQNSPRTGWAERAQPSRPDHILHILHSFRMLRMCEGGFFLIEHRGPYAHFQLRPCRLWLVVGRTLEARVS